MQNNAFENIISYFVQVSIYQAYKKPTGKHMCIYNSWLSIQSFYGLVVVSTYEYYPHYIYIQTYTTHS